MEDERDWGPRPFRFLNAWAAHPTFVSVVEKTWSEYQVEGWAGFRCLVKFKALKQKLKVWNSAMFGLIDAKLKAAEEEAYAIELIAEKECFWGMNKSEDRN